MDKPKNIKRCPMCGWGTNRKSITTIGRYESVSPLCARCHDGMCDFWLNPEIPVQLEIISSFHYSDAWRINFDVQ